MARRLGFQGEITRIYTNFQVSSFLFQVLRSQDLKSEALIFSFVLRRIRPLSLNDRGGCAAGCGVRSDPGWRVPRSFCYPRSLCRRERLPGATNIPPRWGIEWIGLVVELYR